MAGLASLGQIGSGFAGALPESQLKWLQVQQAKQSLAQQLQQTQQQMQSLDAQGAALLQQGGGPQGIPQQGPPPPPMPGQSSQPAAPPPPQQGPPPGPPPPGGSAPQAGPPQQGMSPQRPPMGGGVPQGQAPGLSQNVEGAQRLLHEMAMTIKKANPGISNAVLAQTVSQQVKEIAPLLQAANQTDRLQTQQLINESRLSNARDIAEFKGNLAQILASQKSSTNITIAGMKADTAADAEAGKNRRFDAGESGKNLREDKRLWSQAQRQATSQTQKAAVAQYQVDARQLSAVISQLNSIRANPGTTDPAEVTQLKAQAQELFTRMNGVHQRNPFLPAPTAAAQSFKPASGDEDLGGDSAGGGASAPNQGASAGAPSPPKPGDVIQGYRFKGGDPGDQSSWEKAQ